MSAPTQHRQFVIEREFAAPPAAVFQAWADPALDLSTEVIKRLDAAGKPAATPKQ